MGLLDEKASWDLLSKTVFNEEHCPDELQDIGRDIAGNCKGLPLSIITIGALLSKSDMTLEYWEFVAGNVISLVGIEDDGNCMKILSLSYDNMPIHLKLCFLTLASYPEDTSIRVNDLIKLWRVNAYVKSEAGRRIDEVALDYLNDLVGRNMVFVREFDRIEEIETLGMHDLLLELCRKKASIENVCMGGYLDFYITFARFPQLFLEISNPKLDNFITKEHFEELRIISAYYSGLRLLQLMETVQFHPKNALLNFQSKVHSLMEILDWLSSKGVTSDMQVALPIQAFIHCAFKWRNIIDGHVDQKRQVFRNVSAFNEDIVIVIQEIEQIIQQLASICGECSPLTRAKQDVVRHPYTLLKIKKALYRRDEDCQVITIAGMGGTTLAQKVYEDPATENHFYKRYWVTVSQEYDVQKILQDILDDKKTHEIWALGEKLHKEILKRRYLIVLDDLWSMEAWEDIAKHLPNNNKRSRIIVTTRNSTLAASSSPALIFHTMGLLDEEASWDLLSKKVFNKEHCPDELQDILEEILL